ncbi:MAG: DUF167 domain-containing protein [Planctomycetota bacterium]|nr:DUF167 domain-containing protein [Planctomycetota bacterium]
MCCAFAEDEAGARAGARLAVKVVPGARRAAIVGLLGERLKVRVSSPPERGRANEELCELLARALGVARSAVEVVGGESRPEKQVRVMGLSAARVRDVLGIDPSKQ